MLTHISKWGNSLGIRIPIPLAHQIGLVAGSSVIIAVKNHQLLISKKVYSLENMLKQIKPENIHEEISCGDSVGKEKWE